MATLEDKLLGEKVHNYCSSSEDEDEPGAPTILSDAQASALDSAHWSGTATNTGPKGVIQDWQRFKQLETERREEAEREKLALIKKLSITARTSAEDEEARKQAELDAELDTLMDDDVLLEFQRKRMSEMLAISGQLPVFGRLISLASANELLDAIDKEGKGVTVVLHIYEEQNRACKAMNEALEQLAKDFPNIKFCRIVGAAAGMSMRFKQYGLPALLVYKAGAVIGNFVRISDELGDDFYASDLESFLIEHGFIQDRSCVPTITSAARQNGEQDDDDD